MVVGQRPHRGPDLQQRFFVFTLRLDATAAAS
jgi:hypothetical protein